MVLTMGHDHIKQVVDIHASSWDETEFSVKLGKDFLIAFYNCVVDFPESTGFVSLDDSGNVIAYAIGIFDYDKFNAKFKKRFFARLMLITLKGLLSSRLTALDIYSLFKDGDKTKKLRHPKCHLGALAIANQYKSSLIGLTAVISVIHEVHREAVRRGSAGCWGSCDIKNTAMRKLFEARGYRLTDNVSLPTKTIAVYEKDF